MRPRIETPQKPSESDVSHSPAMVRRALPPTDRTGRQQWVASGLLNTLGFELVDSLPET